MGQSADSNRYTELVVSAGNYQELRGHPGARDEGVSVARDDRDSEVEECESAEPDGWKEGGGGRGWRGGGFRLASESQGRGGRCRWR